MLHPRHKCTPLAENQLKFQTFWLNILTYVNCPSPFSPFRRCHPRRLRVHGVFVPNHKKRGFQFSLNLFPSRGKKKMRIVSKRGQVSFEHLVPRDGHTRYIDGWPALSIMIPFQISNLDCAFYTHGGEGDGSRRWPIVPDSPARLGDRWAPGLLPMLFTHRSTFFSFSVF